MNTIDYNRKYLVLLLCLLTWLPITGLAQTDKYEMVVEKTDGTELAFQITDDYPLLEYQYGGEDGVNTIEIQTANGYTSVPCPEIKRLFTREAKIIRGDITGSGSVDVQDATLTVNYILGKESDGYDFSMADMNNDDEVDVFDVTAIINVVLSGGGGNQSAARRAARERDYPESVHLSADENGLLFDIDQANRFTSFQFDVEVPQGTSLLGVEWNGKTSHSLQFAKNGENRYTVVALSMSSAPLPVFDGSLVRLRLVGSTNGEVTFDNILFVTPEGKASRLNGGTMNMTTGIQGVSYTQGEQIYDISGRQLNMKREQLSKGVYIINNKKVVIK